MIAATVISALSLVASLPPVPTNDRRSWIVGRPLQTTLQFGKHSVGVSYQSTESPELVADKFCSAYGISSSVTRQAVADILKQFRWWNDPSAI
jgi:hypothetical protein